MGFWKSFFGGESDPEEEKRNADERNFDLLKYDGVKAMRMGQVDYAVKCFAKALEIRDDGECHDYLARAYTHQGRYDDALAEVETLIAAEPDNVELMMQAANVAYLKDDYEAMAGYCERALAVDSSNAIVNTIYARAELGRDNLIQAVARLTLATTLDERLIEPRLLRGQTLLRMGDVKGAGDDAEWLAQHAQPSEDILLLLARVETAKGNTDKAIAIYGAVTELNPFNIDAFRERGQLRFDKGDKEGAQEDMQMVMELNPKELDTVNGDYSAEGIEQKTLRAYSNLNPFGI